MDHDRLLDLIEHPTPDPDAARNPVLTTRVLERVRRASAPQPAPAHYGIWLWGTLAALLTSAAFTMPGNALVTGGGLAGAAGLFSGMLGELLAGALIAVVVLACTLQRTQPLSHTSFSDKQPA